MVWREGQYIKDLKYLNRDVRKIVVVDRNAKNVKNHQENVLVLPEFDGDKQDEELKKLLPLLEGKRGVS